MGFSVSRQKPGRHVVILLLNFWTQEDSALAQVGSQTAAGYRCLVPADLSASQLDTEHRFQFDQRQARNEETAAAPFQQVLQILAASLFVVQLRESAGIEQEVKPR